jgi:hypothetical protein
MSICGDGLITMIYFTVRNGIGLNFVSRSLLQLMLEMKSVSFHSRKEEDLTDMTKNAYAILYRFFAVNAINS